MSNDDLIAQQQEEFERQLVDLVADWVVDQAWDCDEDISSIIASTNSIFAEEYFDDINVEPEEAGVYSFTCRGTLYGSPRKDDVPFCGDTIHITVEGLIEHDEDLDEWNISDNYSVFAELEDWHDEEERYEGALSGLHQDLKPSNVGALAGLRTLPNSFLILERTASSADDLIAIISTLFNRHWYRGHSDATWTLRSGIARQKNPSISLETKLRLTFENQTTFLDPASHPLGVAKSNFMMQHHGIPTRLLDWTTSSLTALYFAVCNTDHDGVDACLWVMDPSPLNRLHNKSFPYECDGGKDKIFTEESDRVLAIHAPYTNLRMKMQQSEFTLHAHYRPLEEELGAELFLKEKIIIPHRLKSDVRDRLMALGITRGSLFPDLDNIAKNIKDDILEEGTLP